MSSMTNPTEPYFLVVQQVSGKREWQVGTAQEDIGRPSGVTHDSDEAARWLCHLGSVMPEDAGTLLVWDGECGRFTTLAEFREGHFQVRLGAALRTFGWGPVNCGPVKFERNEYGWMLGNGAVVAPWIGGQVPDDREVALTGIEKYIGRTCL